MKLSAGNFYIWQPALPRHQPRIAAPQTCPTRPVLVIVGFGAGAKPVSVDLRTQSCGQLF